MFKFTSNLNNIDPLVSNQAQAVETLATQTGRTMNVAGENRLTWAQILAALSGIIDMYKLYVVP